MPDSIVAYLKDAAPDMLPGKGRAPNTPEPEIPDLSKVVPVRPPVFALAAERPIFAGIKLAQNELGEHQISAIPVLPICIASSV